MFFLNHVMSENLIEPTVSRWSSSRTFFSGLTTLQILAEIQNMMTDEQLPGQMSGKYQY